jgi:Transposase DDE domain
VPRRAGDTPQICPTPNCVASVRIFPSPHGTRTPQASQLTGYPPRRRFLRLEERLPLAVAAEKLPALEDRLRLVQEVAYRWGLGASERRAAPAAAVAARQEPSAQRSDSGLPVGQDYGGGRQRARLRPSKEKVEGRKRHLLVDTERMVLKAKIHSAKVPDQDGLRVLLESAQARLSRLKHLWVDAGYQGRGRRWAEEALGLSVEVVRKPPKPLPEQVAKMWAEEWAKEGKEVDWQGLMPPGGFRVLPRR